MDLRSAPLAGGGVIAVHPLPNRYQNATQPIIGDVKVALSDNVRGQLGWPLGVSAAMWVAMWVATRVAKPVTPAVDHSGTPR